MSLEPTPNSSVISEAISSVTTSYRNRSSQMIQSGEGLLASTARRSLTSERGQREEVKGQGLLTSTARRPLTSERGQREEVKGHGDEGGLLDNLGAKLGSFLIGAPKSDSGMVKLLCNLTGSFFTLSYSHKF